ncbi:hypothetical protein PC120_g8612 [Phytophthora cactorum]|nr:hypothetical protein PC120_g8612 [Phytophthora cactorum]
MWSSADGRHLVALQKETNPMNHGVSISKTVCSSRRFGEFFAVWPDVQAASLTQPRYPISLYVEGASTHTDNADGAVRSGVAAAQGVTKAGRRVTSHGASVVGGSDSRGSGCFVAVAVTRGGEAVSKGGSSGSGLATGVEGPASRGDGTGAAAGVVRSGVRTGRGTGKAAKPTVRSEPTVMRGASSRVGERDDVAGGVRGDGSDNLARIGGYDLAAGVILVVVKFELGSVLLVLKVVLVQDPVKHPNVLSVLLHPWYISSW